MNSGATPAAIFLALGATLVAPGCDASDPALTAGDAPLEGSTTDDWAETEQDTDEAATEAAPLDPAAVPEGDFAAAPDTVEASWTCGFGCAPGSYPIGSGCSTSCGGSCPNMVLCESIPTPDPEAEIWATPSTVSVPEGTLGSTEICWRTKYVGAPLWIRVRVNGGPGQLFTKESDNGTECEDAPWIGGGDSYSFTVHKWNADTAPALDNTVVTGVTVPGSGDSGDSDSGDTAGDDDGGIGCGGCQPGWDCHCFDQCWPAGNACP